MPQRNDQVSRDIRKSNAAERQELRQTRTNEQQVQMILARGGNPNGKEIMRLTNEQGLDKMTLDEWEQAQKR